MIWPQSGPKLQTGRLYPSEKGTSVRVSVEQTVGKIMSNSQLPLLALLLAFGASAAPASVVGSDAQACLSGKPSMVVLISGFKQETGTVKVAVYAVQSYLATRGAPVRS
jgi:hypothetical protein